MKNKKNGNKNEEHNRIKRPMVVVVVMMRPNYVRGGRRLKTATGETVSARHFCTKQQKHQEKGISLRKPAITDETEALHTQ
jgi:hypothetical protein